MKADGREEVLPTAKKKLEVQALLDNLQECISQGEADLERKATSWLDVGSGDGILAAWMARSEMKFGTLKAYDVLHPKDNVHAADLSECSEESPLQIHLFDGENLPEPDESFDIVSAIFALHHAGTKQESLLREMIRTSRHWLVITEDVNEPEFVERNRQHDAHGVFRTIAGWKEMFVSLGAVSIIREGWCKPETVEPRGCQYFFILEKKGK